MSNAVDILHHLHPQEQPQGDRFQLYFLLHRHRHSFHITTIA